MFSLKALLVVAFVAASSVSSASIAARQSSVSCGGHSISSSQIQTALQTGYDDYQNGSSPSGYPHAYYQYADEHITLQCGGNSYHEFPITGSTPFTGGSPGAYRVIFNDDGDYCATVYHASKSDNSFAQCN
ncbi:ribonuclease t1 [Ceraceosorus bombacis]|uniref:Ribonuclease t1 n=1 Tax=Ceraceosorus bombacis TaxID=401625 RepID=A0A0P1BAI5_9BASI|nr:ribonuclease t1 [Ceraceosorus bombacis]